MPDGRGTGTADNEPITLVAVGDVRPCRDDPPSLFRYCRDVFSAADIVFGQCEVGLSDRGKPQFTPTVPLVLAARNISALTEDGAGFDVMSFASNHSMDYGEEALFDTLDILSRNNIAVVGAGRNIEEARQPVIVERNSVKVGFLAYNSILHPGLQAEENLPGVAPLWASHHYWQWDYQAGTPPVIITQLWPENRQAMEEDIVKLRPQVDVLVVSQHSGVHFVPAMIAQYQKEAAHAAIDCGADLVLQHHAHILKGIEMYRGKAIFYGLGNFACDLVPRARPAGDPVARRQHEFYKIKKVPGYPKHTFHPDALKTMIAKAYIAGKQIQKVTYIPTYINPENEPEVVKRSDPKAQEVFDYVKAISDTEDLKASFSWDGDEVLVSD
ncbi:MAG: CapA family protein [Bacteroidetes bacterium]|nr:CapA family protein [Bacteroidota bacterium]MCL5025087.1 CapA family protein [Chloroflexota bacterium]